MRGRFKVLATALLLSTTVGAVLGTHERGVAWTSDDNQVAVFGGNDWEYLSGMVADSAGNIYTTGSFQNTVDFDPGQGTTNLTSAGSNDVFVTKTNPSGTLVWAKSIGGTGNDIGHALTIDGSGNVFIVGRFEGTMDFDPGPGTALLTSTGFDDGFIVKLDANGAYGWARAIGGLNADYAYGVAVDSAGSVFTAGHFQGTVDFDPGAATENRIASGGNDAFLQKLDANGQFVWAAKFGSPGNDYGQSVAVDNSGNVVLHGHFEGIVDFDPSVGTENRTAVGNQDVYVVKLNSGGQLQWVSVFGGPGYEYSAELGRSITVDDSGNVYSTGYFAGSVDFDPSAGATFTLTSAGNLDIYVTKLNSSGALIWAKAFGGPSADYGTSIAVDSLGNVYTVGSFKGTADFDPSAAISNLASPRNGDSDAFIAKLDSTGAFLWAKSFVGTAAGNAFCFGFCPENNESAYGASIDGQNNVYVAGQFVETVDFDPGIGVESFTSNGGGDMFVVKMDATGSTTKARPMTSIPIRRVTFDPNGGTCTDTTPRTQPWDSWFALYRYIPAATDCTRPGHTFTGWARTTTPTTPVDLPLLVDPSDGVRRYFIGENANLIAIWTKNPEPKTPTVFVALDGFFCRNCGTWLIWNKAVDATSITVTAGTRTVCTAYTFTIGDWTICNDPQAPRGTTTYTLTATNQTITTTPITTTIRRR